MRNEGPLKPEPEMTQHAYSRLFRAGGQFLVCLQKSVSSVKEATGVLALGDL